MNTIRNYLIYDATLLMADSFTSTADDVFETTEVDAADVILNVSGAIGSEIAINVNVEAADAGDADETYTLKVEEGDAVGFGGVVNILYQGTWTRGETGPWNPPIVVVPSLSFLRCQVMGTGTTPSWTLTIWPSPAS